jgi:hypothetical protein
VSLFVHVEDQMYHCVRKTEPGQIFQDVLNTILE